MARLGHVGVAQLGHLGRGTPRTPRTWHTSDTAHLGHPFQGGGQFFWGGGNNKKSVKKSRSNSPKWAKSATMICISARDRDTLAQSPRPTRAPTTVAMRSPPPRGPAPGDGAGCVPTTHPYRLNEVTGFPHAPSLPGKANLDPQPMGSQLDTAQFATKLRELAVALRASSNVAQHRLLLWPGYASGRPLMSAALAATVTASTLMELAHSEPGSPVRRGDVTMGTRQQLLRASRCGHCAGCVADSCGVCNECLDKRRFGGQGKRKRACLTRVCTKATRRW